MAITASTSQLAASANKQHITDPCRTKQNRAATSEHALPLACSQHGVPYKQHGRAAGCSTYSICRLNELISELTESRLRRTPMLLRAARAGRKRNGNAAPSSMQRVVTCATTPPPPNRSPTLDAQRRSARLAYRAGSGVHPRSPEITRLCVRRGKHRHTPADPHNHGQRRKNMGTRTTVMINERLPQQ